MNFSLTVPPDAQNHGDPGLLCLPPGWTDYFIFYATNYFAHAATLISHPGESLQETLLATANALFIPGAGALRAFRFLVLYLRGGPSTPLGKASRAGALCMVVDQNLLRDAARITEGTPNFFFGENIRPIPPGRAIHGVCSFPEPGNGVPKYLLVEVPPNMPLGPYARVVPAIGSIASRSESDIADMGDDVREMHLSKNHNPPKLLVSIIQIIWGIVTLYKTRGNQIALYGAGAYGLTVAPYAIMSIINLATNIMRPEYAAMYLVHSTEMDEAVGHGGEFRAMDEMDFTGGYDRPMDNRVYFIANAFGYLTIAILPFAIVGGFTHFQSGSNVSIRISWILGWLIVGSVSSLWVRVAQQYGDSRHPIWETILVIPLWIPAIGGFVVVGQMLKDFGICTSFDR